MSSVADGGMPELEPPPAFEIDVEVDAPFAAAVDVDELVAVASAALRHEGVEGPAELGIWITNEDEVHQLNRTYRGVDSSTDVLSFGEDDDDEARFVLAPGAVHHLGDIAISYPHVVRQAGEYGHSQTRELAYLLVHGLLHVLGYDHEQSEAAAEMRTREEAILLPLGITRESLHGRESSNT